MTAGPPMNGGQIAGEKKVADDATAERRESGKKKSGELSTMSFPGGCVSVHYK